MQVWLAIVDRRGAATGEAVDGLLDLILPFHPHVTGQESWRSEDSTAALYAWTNGPQGFPSGVASGSAGAVSLSGYVLDEGQLASPGVLLDRLSGAGADRAVGHLGGVFSLVHIAAAGAVRAWNTQARLEHVYWATQGGRTVISNRALAAHLVANRSRRPAYNVDFIRSLLAAGFPTTQAVPLAGVSILPSGSRLQVTRRGATVRRLPPPPPSGDPAASLTRALTNSVSFLPAVDPAPRSALTGGKDSRLIAAVLAGAGVPFSAMTGGLDEHPDVIVAARAADILGVPHIRTRAGAREGERAPTHLEHHVLADSLRRIFGSDATHPAFELISRDVRVPSAAGVVLGGQGGELLRGGYAKKPVPSHKAARQSLQKLALRHGSYLREAARSKERAGLDRWLARSVRLRHPSAALWRYHLDYRTGRWAAAGYAAASVGRPRVWPYFDAGVVRAIAAVDPERRIDESLLVDTLSSLAPALVDLPLVGSRWQYEQSGPVDGDRAGWEARAPLTAPPGRASFDWRFHFSSGLGALFVDTITPMLARPELDSVVASAEVNDLLNRLRRDQLDGDRSGGHFAWLLFSVALLLSDQWLDPDPPKDVIRFPVPL
ncbi:MAG: asparagine synthase-related protein [Acidimicrobiia bacterium]